MWEESPHASNILGKLIKYGLMQKNETGSTEKSGCIVGKTMAPFFILLSWRVMGRGKRNVPLVVVGFFFFGKAGSVWKTFQPAPLTKTNKLKLVGLPLFTRFLDL